MGKFKMPSIKEIEQEEASKTKEVKKEQLKVGAGLFSDVSKGSVVMKVTNIPREKIKKNENNNYSIKGIASLAESIRSFGLAQPLHVAPEKDGVYILLGGERRLTAIDRLIEDPAVDEWNEDTLIPCVVKGIDDVKLDLSPENKERYAIITTNREQRQYTDGDKFMEVQEWKKIIEELREKGYEYISQYDEEGNEKEIPIKGAKTRDILSQTTGMSRGQVNKFETVNNQGSSDLKNALLDGKISVSVAEKAAKEMTEEEQDRVAKEADGKKVTSADIDRLKDPVENAREKITPEVFRKDVKKITSALKEKAVMLDEKGFMKYHSLITQIEKLLGGHE